MNIKMNKLCENMPADFQAALIATEENRFYFLGFDSGDAGTALILKDKAYFIIDSRYIEIAQREVKCAEVVLQDKLFEQIAMLLKENNINKLNIESKMPISFATKLKKEIQGVEIETSNTLSDKIDEIRAIKSQDEIASIKAAQVITDKALQHILPILKPGMREIDLALEMEFFMRKNGAGKLAFNTILVSGAKTSLPHGEPGEKLIEYGDFVTMDFGANVNGYCTDMTRTVAIGSASEEMKNVYETVLKAQLAGCKAVKNGVKGCEVDKVSRDIIYAAGFEGCFGHGLGHAVGIEIHENPRFSPICSDIIKSGMVMTVEPGIYLAGKFGVRIEDTVVVTDSGCDILAKSDKNLIIVG